MSDTSNTQILKNYLVGQDGYLLNSSNHGKVIMLSGVWGSGKTYFWHDSQGSIQSQLKKQKKANIYISLYGKTSLKSIENEVFVKASNGNDDDAKDSVEKFLSTFSSLSSTIDQYSGIPVASLIAEYFCDLKKSNSDNKAKEFMKDDLIICFDDFERKSTEVNLNDLFGFITNLALEYKATIVIILNDDIFEGKDKKIFANLKEKSVNKFLKFQPNSKELFDLIVSIYTIEDKYKQIILDSIDEMKVLNARIYKNILENLEEYLKKNKNMSNPEIRYFVLTIINFNINHIIFKFYDYNRDFSEDWTLPSYFSDLNDIPSGFLWNLHRRVETNNKYIQSELINTIKSNIELTYKNIEEPDKKNEIKATEKLSEDLKKVDKYADMIWFFWKLEVMLDYRKNVNKEKQVHINTFIETGILN